MAVSANSQVLIFHDLIGQYYSRRLLSLHSPHNSTNPPSSSNNPSTESLFLGDGNFDANVIMVLSVLLCALFCSLGLNSIIRCALRCSNIIVLSNNNGSSLNLPAAALVANTGVKKKALKTFPTVTYSSELNLPGLDTECVICLSEFKNGHRLRILPKCNHGFHVHCIDKWLRSHSSCPKCRHCLIQTCQKIVGSRSSTTTTSSQPSSVPSAETIVRIVPLEPEGMVRHYA
ncbi:hypothetical protein QN277_025924 [Acacia crassicarpa]|uniref:RING-type E3 ubiquitin transferase n=1 Tax=Acacia crassicarpa TaxID=499986 RepID=A0AAE1JAX8_9FABA|nr:hypothetical protein QN277_025924 [Acacia crassicarpa]